MTHILVPDAQDERNARRDAWAEGIDVGASRDEPIEEWIRRGALPEQNQVMCQPHHSADGPRGDPRERLDRPEPRSQLDERVPFALDT